MKKMKMEAIAIVAIMLTASLAVGAIAVDKSDDSEAVIGIDDVLLWGGIIALIASSAYLGFQIGTNLGDGEAADSEVRGYEADTVAQLMTTGVSYNRNAMLQHSENWRFTNEHWIRQSELAASEMWRADSEYDPSDILALSGTYLNSSYMLVNAAAQINEHYKSIAERMGIWNTRTLYEDKMTLSFGYGIDTFRSSSSWGCDLVTVASAVGTYNLVYISGGEIHVFGKDATTITSGAGTKIVITDGYANLDSIESFKPGVYALESGADYAGSILPVYEFAAATVTTGIIMEAGSEKKLATYYDRAIHVDGHQYDSLSLSIIPSGAETKTVDMTATLEDYDSLLRTILSTMGETNSAAKTVWNIYSAAGRASSYLTTLTVPNNYDNINVTQAQQEIITVLALEQLSGYYTANAGCLKTRDYLFSNGSLTLFIRGDIIGSDGKVLYGNVIFTPFYYTIDQTLSNGPNTQTQRCLVALWSYDVETLSSWDRAASTSTASLVEVTPGSVLNAYEIMYGDRIVNSVDLDVKNIHIIDPERLSAEPHPDSDNSRWSMAVFWFCTIAGTIALLYGIRSGNPIWIGIGIAAICIGVFASGYIGRLIEKYVRWGWL